MEKFPPAEERVALLDALAELVERAGAETFLGAPLLEPSARHFPDRWEANVRGVHTLARRLLGYVGLGDLEVEVELGDGRIDVNEHGHRGAAAWFYGIVDGVCVLGASEEQLEDGEQLVGVMAHEAAHAWRTSHELVDDDRDLEERLTDLTTIYLGFGILTTNSTHRYRASGELHGSYVTTRYSHDRAGYLSPQAMSYLLACQVTARRLAAGEQRRIAGLLSPNQAACFRESLKLLEPDDLAQRLGLPDASLVPAAASPAPAPLEVVDERLPEGDEPEPPEDVCRLVGTRSVHGLLVGGFLGLVLVLVMAMKDMGSDALGAALVLGLPVAGFLVGRKLRFEQCSGTDCDSRLPPDAVVCPRCGGRITRTIARLVDRLDD